MQKYTYTIYSQNKVGLQLKLYFPTWRADECGMKTHMHDHAANSQYKDGIFKSTFILGPKSLQSNL